MPGSAYRNKSCSLGSYFNVPSDDDGDDGNDDADGNEENAATTDDPSGKEDEDTIEMSDSCEFSSMIPTSSAATMNRSSSLVVAFMFQLLRAI